MKQHLLRLFLFLLLVGEVSAQKATDFSVTHYTNENGLPQNSVRGVELDKDGFLWIATEAGLVRFDGQRFRLYDREHYSLLQSNRITDLANDDNGILIFSDEFWNHYDFNHQGIPQYFPLSDYKQRASQPSFWVRGDSVLYRPQNWIIWVPGLRYETTHGQWGTLNNRLYYREQSILWSIDTNRNITRVKVIGLLSGKSFKVNGLYSQGKTLYLHAGKGIYRLSEGRNKELKATLVLKTEVQNIGFYRNYPELNLQVIGTYTDGVYLFHRKQFATLKHSNGFGNYYPQAPLGDSGVLTDKGPVYPSSSRFDYPFRNLIPFRSILLDSRGSYWISEGIYGRYNIMKLDPKLQVLKRFPSNFTANCFRETSDGRIWVCSYQGRSLGYVNQDSVRWLPFQWRHPQSILTFLPIDNEIFWIGGVGILAKLNVKTGQQIHYKSLEKFTIESLYLDSDKVLWIGTTGNGFFALKQNRIFKLPLDTRAGLKDVHSFIEDKNGFMWMSTNNGLFRCRKEDLKNFIEQKATTVYYQYFSKESGFNTNEFNGSCTPSAVVLGNGKFSFPSMNGLVQFHPDSIRELLPEAKIFIDRLLVDGKEQDLSKHPTLDPSFGHLEIEVVSPFFGNPANQQIEYNVKGLDQNWYPVKNDNVVTLNNLPYGKYSLQFRKRVGFGSNNIITTALSFTVLPFFYQTWYFRLLILALVACMLFSIIKIRYAYLLKRNRQLELEVSQRTIHLKNANKLKEKLLLMVGHDLRSPLHFLGILAQDVRHSVANGEQDKISSAAEEIHDTTRKLHAFVEEFSLWARLQDEQYNLRKRNFQVSDLLEELKLFFEETLQAHNNRLELPIDEDQELYTNPELLKAILRNLIDNANKHTRDGHIRISWQENNDTGRQLCISDTGNGMSSLELNNIRRRIQQFQEPTAIKPGSQLGYQLIIDFATRLDLSLQIDSEKGIGTTVTISGIQVHNSNRYSGSFPAETVDRSKLH